MRTTMNLPDDLHRQLRIRAAEEHRTVTSLVEEALRKLLAAPPDAERPRYRITPVGTGSASVDVNDNSALLDYLDGLRPDVPRP